MFFPDVCIVSGADQAPGVLELNNWAHLKIRLLKSTCQNCKSKVSPSVTDSDSLGSAWNCPNSTGTRSFGVLTVFPIRIRLLPESGSGSAKKWESPRNTSAQTDLASENLLVVLLLKRTWPLASENLLVVLLLKLFQILRRHNFIQYVLHSVAPYSRPTCSTQVFSNLSAIGTVCTGNFYTIWNV